MPRQRPSPTPPSQKARIAATCAFVAALGVLGLAFWKFLPEDRPIRTPIVTVDEQTQKQRLEMLNQIPAAPTPGTARPPAPPSNIAVTPKAQEAGPKAQAGVGPITLGGTPAGKALAAAPVPTALAAPTLKIGNPADADPMELAFHPSHFADPMRVVKTIGTAVVPAAEPRAGGGGMGPVSLSAVPASGAAGGPDRGALPAARVGPALAVDPYAEAVRLERARAFTMSLCTDLQGRIWIGSENTTPGDGTGGVQCFDPSKPPLQAFTQYLSNESADRTRSVSKGARVFGGLGDDNAYAIACDLQGRIWVGHLNHGVSVFNGEKWQNYEVVAGLSIPNSLSGPLGERIFKIVVAPNFSPSPALPVSPSFTDPLTGKVSDISGSIWMCTSTGLSIYFPSTDTWSYLTRADGLPSDQANSLAFAKDGTLYVATQCDGIAIASPTAVLAEFPGLPSEFVNTGGYDVADSGLTPDWTDLTDFWVSTDGTQAEILDTPQSLSLPTYNVSSYYIPSTAVPNPVVKRFDSGGSMKMHFEHWSAPSVLDLSVEHDWGYWWTNSNSFWFTTFPPTINVPGRSDGFFEYCSGGTRWNPGAFSDEFGFSWQ